MQKLALFVSMSVVTTLFQTPAFAFSYFTKEDRAKIIDQIHVPVDETDDIYRIKEIAQSRTPEDCKMAIQQAEWSARSFFGDQSTDILSAQEFSLVEGFLGTMTHDVDQSVLKLKREFKRVRPYKREPRIVVPCPGELSDHGSSFPSGHSTAAYLQALILSEIFPSRKEKLMARAHEIGRGRMILGVHFPSDVKTGFKIAERSFDILKSRKNFKNEIANLKTKIQLLSFQKKGQNKESALN